MARLSVFEFSTGSSSPSWLKLGAILIFFFFELWQNQCSKHLVTTIGSSGHLTAPFFLVFTVRYMLWFASLNLLSFLLNFWCNSSSQKIFFFFKFKFFLIGLLNILGFLIILGAFTDMSFVEILMNFQTFCGKWTFGSFWQTNVITFDPKGTL